MAEERPIEAPAFQLIEDDPSMLDRPRRQQPLEVENLSILDPKPLPEEPSGLQLVRIIITVAIVLLVCGAIFLASNQGR